MSCGYLYEIRRKSEEFENSQKPQHIHLRTFSEEEDDDIWEVPEESFDNAYQTIDENEDDDANEDEEEDNNVGNNDFQRKSTSNKNPSNILQNFEIFSAQRLRLSLSAEQISLKSQQQQWKAETTKQEIINKSINTEEDVQCTRPVVVSTNNSSASTTSTSTTTNTTTTDCGSSTVKWKNIKINNKTKENEQNMSTQLNGIPLLPLILNQTRKKLQAESEAVPEIKLNLNNYPLTVRKYGNTTSRAISVTQKSEPQRKFSLESVTMQGPHIDLGLQKDYCTSPESIVDNILSNASSVSVQSSSLSSGILTDDGDELKFQNNNPFKILNRPSESNTQSNIFERKFISDAKSQLNRCCQLIESDRPIIMVTQASPSSTSSSTINNTTSSESYDTATAISRQPSFPVSDDLVIHASSPEPLQYPLDLLCQICGQFFKDPRCLNCLHTFCLQCIVNENFKEEDESISLCTGPTKNIGSAACESQQNLSQNEHRLRASSSSRGSSTSPDSTNADLSAPTQKLRSSFSFKLRRPSDSPAKTKSEEGSRTASDSSTTSSDHSQSLANISRKITCKICQHTMNVPAGGIRQLPQNQMAIRKIHEFQFKITDPGNSCNLCYDETNQASHHCETCSLYLCTLCKDAHTRQKTTVNHDIKQIEKLQTDQKASNSCNSNIKLKCNLHQGFDIKSFCTTCLQVACTDCLILQHKGHKYEAIPKASQCYARLLRDSTEQTRLILKNTEHSLNKLNDFSEIINKKCDALQREVEEFMGRYIEAVEAHKWALLEQINQARETKLSAISKQHAEIEKHNQEALTAITFGQELTDIASSVEILSFVKILLKRFEYCQLFRSPIDSKLTNCPNFFSKIQATPCKELKEIPVFGIITMQTVEPTQCTLQWNGFSQLRLHKKVDLTLISRDADGLPMSYGGLKIQSHVKYKDVNSKCLRIEITDNNDGTYSISFTPDTEGTIILMITINDKHIKGSPFSFLSRPVRPHTGIYHCCTFCSSKGNKFATCSCDGHMPGYSGCGHGHTGHPGHRHWSCCGEVLRNSECQFSNRSLNPK